MGAPRAAAAAVLGGAAAASTLRALRASPLAPTLERTNHAGATVTLGEGPALVAGAALGSVLAGPAPVVAALGAGAFGALDDLAGDSRSKGLRGHLGALARGEVTTGALKILGIGATAAVAAALTDRRATRRGPVASVAGAATIALGANLGNLLDLRPGRALKAGLLVAVPLLVAGARERSATAAVAGASLALLPEDLAGRAMLGDTGANALGAALATAYVGRAGLRGRAAAAAALLALTLASERVSFTKVIESTPVLRELDQWGRAPR